MRGKSRTRPTADLPLIFWHIRTTRDRATRRSWQRRARLALAKRADLTPAEQHEICAVWSRLDCQAFDSPALRKVGVIGHRPPAREDWQRKPARSAMRAAFGADGQRRAASTGRIAADYGDAANDPFGADVVTA